jgi:hypothetical protein
MSDPRADLADLVDYLARLEANGVRIPCRLGPIDTRACWTSDSPADQEYAARRCVPCRAVTECKAHGLAHPDSWGVYGGLIDAERRPRIGRPRKEQTA